jgi:hypothetical protein
MHWDIFGKILVPWTVWYLCHRAEDESLTEDALYHPSFILNNHIVAISSISLQPRYWLKYPRSIATEQRHHNRNCDESTILKQWKCFPFSFLIQSVPGGNVNILGGRSIGHSRKKVIWTCVLFQTVSNIWHAVFWIWRSIFSFPPTVMHHCPKHVNWCKASVGCCDCCSLVPLF